MGNWLETLIDWNISRNRFWGTPLPVWECQNGHYQVIGGKEEIEKLGGKVPNDLHRPFIDNVKLKCPDCSEEMVRSSDVMDVWMDSGAMPFAQWHYPFENQETFKKWYPADYIVEAIDQTRGWFFTLMAEAILLGNDAPSPFKNVLTTGHILDENNLKMSKSKGNIVDPFEIIPEIGADAIRWYMCTAASAGESFPFSANLVKEKQRKFSLILWNSYKFFVDYANVTGWTCELQRGELTVLDKWILAKFTELVKFVNKSLDEYDLIRSSRAIEEFVVNDFSTWYIRRSRDRVSLLAEESDRNTCLSVMYGVLVGLSKLLAPFMPFMSEEMYRNLTDDISVHLTDFPKGDASLLDKQLIADMQIVRSVVEKGHSKRKESSIKLRQPLAKVSYQAANKLSEELEQIVADELNVKEVEFGKKSDEPEVELDMKITPELAKEGEAREIIRNIQKMRKEQDMTLKDSIEVGLPSWPAEFAELIKKQTNTVSLIKSENLEIRKLEV
jgi:isoleucyl-tRNA synthetase